MGVRNQQRETIERLESKTLDAQQFPAWGFSLEKSPVFVFHVVIPFDTMLP